MTQSSGGGRGGDMNAPILTTDQGRAERPQTLLEAISDIQQFYVIEGQGQDIPSDFLTISRSLDFFKIGAKSGFVEGIALALLTPFFAFWLMPFVLKAPDLVTKIIFGAVPYLMVIINTALCSYIGRYYVGNITRKSINSLLTGRTMSLLIKALLIYVFYYFLYHLSTPARVWEVAKHLGSRSERIYYGYLEIMPQLVPVATQCAVLMAVAAVVPYGMVYSLDHWSRFKLKRNLRRVSAR